MLSIFTRERGIPVIEEYVTVDYDSCNTTVHDSFISSQYSDISSGEFTVPEIDLTSQKNPNVTEKLSRSPRRKHESGSKWTAVPSRQLRNQKMNSSVVKCTGKTTGVRTAVNTKPQNNTRNGVNRIITEVFVSRLNS